MKQDDIYHHAIHPQGFVFDDTVAAVFADMISRSVPGYGQTLQMIELLAHQYAQAGSNLYDLGCSLGAASLALSRGSADRECRVVAIDNSPAMIDRCRDTLASQYTTDQQTDIRCQDILTSDIQNASVVVLNFVLQFIDLAERDRLLTRIYKGLRPGGIVILSEKIHFDDAEENERQIILHEAFKRAHGYSELEVARKRTALEHVLLPETMNKHHQRLQQAGFNRCSTWFQCFNFASIIAWK